MIDCPASYRDRAYYGTPDHMSLLPCYGERTRNTRRDNSIANYNYCKGGKISIPPYESRPGPLAFLA
jgi:hypothetical protein